MTDKNKSVFPIVDGTYVHGITLREYYAGIALASVLTARSTENYSPDKKAVAERAVMYAEALIDELDKKHD